MKKSFLTNLLAIGLCILCLFSFACSKDNFVGEYKFESLSYMDEKNPIIIEYFDGDNYYGYKIEGSNFSISIREDNIIVLKYDGDIETGKYAIHDNILYSYDLGIFAIKDGKKLKVFIDEEFVAVFAKK